MYNYLLVKLNVNYRLKNNELMGKSNGDNELKLLIFKTFMILMNVLLSSARWNLILLLIYLISSAGLFT